MAQPLLRADCSLTNTGVVPLNDLGPGTYKGVAGGLYPAGFNTPPAAHAAAALAIATDQITPLDASGNPDLNNGRIVMVSIGMSNTTQEFASKGTQNFKRRADLDPAKNPQLVLVDGAQGAQDATAWIDPNALTWSTVNQRLTAAGVTPAQVQVAWFKQALGQPNNYGAFPAHAQALQADLEIILRHLKTRFPNIRIAYCSPRTRAYTNTPTGLNPEPFAYETGFAVKWTIADQINGAGNLNFDPAQGTVVAPLVLWGPYIWADGLTARSDGFTWLCADLESDFTHPSATGGVPKVADHLLAFFKTDPTAMPWFLRSSVVGQPPTVNASASVSGGAPPLSVGFTASASDPDGTITGYQWTFDDGTFSTAQNPVKIFPAPGNYSVHLTVTDDSGNTVSRTLPITVASPQSSPIPTPTPTTTHFAVSAPGSAVQYFPFNITVTAQDQFNNTVTDYAGTVHFTSTDTGVNGTHLPADNTLVNGTRVFFSVMLGTPGIQTITATDTIDASITGTSNPILVNAKTHPTPTPTPTQTPTPTPATVSISGNVRYCTNAGLPPIPGVTMTLTGSASGSTVTDGAGSYTFTGLASGGNYTVTPSIAALPTGAGANPNIDTVDVAAARRQYLLLPPLLTDCPLTAADVDEDTFVDTVDVAAIRRYYLQLTTALANVGQYRFSPVNRLYLGLGSNQTAQGFDALVLGDIGSGFVHLPEGGPAGDGANSSELPATVAAVALPRVAVDQTQSNFIAAVKSSDIDAQNKLIGFQGDFTFDERVITFQSKPVQKAGLTSGNWDVSGNVLPGAGPIRTLRISATSNDFTPLSGSGSLFELRMTRVNQAAQSTQLLWVAPSPFIFIDADLKTQRPGNAAPGSVTPSGRRK